MSHRKTITIVAAAALLLLMTSAAFARNHMGYGPGSGQGYGPGYQQQMISPEQQQKCRELMDQSRARLQPVYEQLWAKQTELDALSRNPNTRPETISKMVQDLSALRAQLAQEHEKLRAALEKETGIAGYGRGMPMMGMGMAPGMHHGGMRQGGMHHGGWR